MADESERATIAQPDSLFPVRAITCDPANLNTADCNWLCRCDDGCTYAIKDGTKNPFVPHSEWFCTQLAERVSIAAPACKIVEMHDRTHVFGSRWEGGVLSKSDWIGKLQRNEISLTDIAPVLSRIFAFDHFVYNDDRHAGNFIVRDQAGGYAVLAFDYSRSWLFHGFPLPALPFAQHQNTRQLQQQIRRLLFAYIDSEKCTELLDRIRNINVSTIEDIIESHPESWLDPKNRDDILDWWGSTSFVDRISSIAKGIEDGSYL